MTYFIISSFRQSIVDRVLWDTDTGHALLDCQVMTDDNEVEMFVTTHLHSTCVPCVTKPSTHPATMCLLHDCITNLCERNLKYETAY